LWYLTLGEQPATTSVRSLAQWFGTSKLLIILVIAYGLRRETNWPC